MQKPKKPRAKTSRYSIASLFSGAGLLDFGFTENGYEIAWGSEVVPEVARTLNHNLGLRYGQGRDGLIQARDIGELDIGALPKVRGVIGGPPCQDFSIGNVNGPGVMGPRGRLIWEYLAAIRTIEPDFFLFENAAGLYRTRQHREQALEPLIRRFIGMGYTVWAELLNSLEFGVPQDRVRVFIVGFKTAIISSLKERGKPGFQWPQKAYQDPKKAYRWPSTWKFGYRIDEEEAIRRLTCPYELTVHSVIGRTDEFRNLSNHKTFIPHSSKFKRVAEGDDRNRSFKRLHRFRYSPTVAYGNNEVHLHPTEPRRLTVRESLRIQTAPDWFEFPEDLPLSHMFKMVGNGVPTKLASMLAIKIRQVLDDYRDIIGSSKV